MKMDKNAYKAIRNLWNRKPETQVVPNKKKYSRKKDRQKVKSEIDTEKA